ncbi:glucoside xylosyltransferase 2-like [Macrobrachium rosenbergii]|uniref:glucoside xylosyltransferase 2-like n=1 Tax=Macrobrachium rosenbergii TaxID=79674 RepID=UPI0034D764BE
MLKSAVALTTKKLRFLVIADSKKLYHKFAEIPSHWPEDYQRKISMEYRYIWYPPERLDMRNMFRVCATERLFLPEMFPELDAAIYIDTDLIFMRPPDDLWNEFDRFNDRQVAAMAPCLYHYGTKRNKVPFYGTSGLNAGIMHLNLTRLSTFPNGGWFQQT